MNQFRVDTGKPVAVIGAGLVGTGWTIPNPFARQLAGPCDAIQLFLFGTESKQAQLAFDFVDFASLGAHPVLNRGIPNVKVVLS